MNPVNGLLLVDKPTGMTSHDVVSNVRRVLGIRSIGHAGTLDPLASGLLILLIGEATKISDYLLNGDKGYEVTVRLGLKTDSMDRTGRVLKEAPLTATEAEVRALALSLQGAIELEVPVHSAVKVHGRRLYEFAHKGERPEAVPKRLMRFSDIEVAQVSIPMVTVRLRCSKGGFIRAWANHLGETLGCGGTVETLRRLFSEPLSLENAIDLEELVKRWESRTERHGRVLGPAWVPLRDALPHFLRIDIGEQDERLMRNGQISKLVQEQLLSHVRVGEPLPPVRIVSRETEDLVALLSAEAGQFYKFRRVFHRS